MTRAALRGIGDAWNIRSGDGTTVVDELPYGFGSVLNDVGARSVANTVYMSAASVSDA